MGFARAMASIRFCGAAGTVTGSKFLLEHAGKKVLIDCGLFQGPKALRERNWAPHPFPPREVDAVVLTHAHIDHTGSLPRLVKDGFDGPIYSTSGTRDLSALLLPDSAMLQEEEARYANKERYSRHHPALPLYSVDDANRALRQFETFGYGRPREILPGLRLTFSRAGHILGSAVCSFELLGTGQRVVFSGDLGRYNAPILRDPEAVAQATTLITETTYGDRTHGDQKPVDTLERIVNEAVARGGMLVVPAFAVGRTQEILYYLRELEEAGRIPTLPVFVDSPMACDATPLYLAHAEEHDLDMQAVLDRGGSPLSTRKTVFARSQRQSMEINRVSGPGVIISASGMATGGRVLHHLKQRLPDARSTVLFVGYQAEGTRGRRLLEGEREVKLHGQVVPVAATIAQVSGFSAHADWSEMLRWMEGFSPIPKQTLLVHGEASALAAQQARLEAKGWATRVPKHLETIAVVDA
jgi:metallo-beta-lactamase family protein